MFLFLFNETSLSLEVKQCLEDQITFKIWRHVAHREAHLISLSWSIKVTKHVIAKPNSKAKKKSRDDLFLPSLNETSYVNTISFPFSTSWGTVLLSFQFFVSLLHAVSWGLFSPHSFITPFEANSETMYICWVSSISAFSKYSYWKIIKNPVHQFELRFTYKSNESRRHRYKEQ